MSSFNQLNDYLNENKKGTTSSSANNLKDSVLSFFNAESFKGSTTSLDSNLSDNASESWFREADNDPYCPKLVSFQSNSKINSTFYNYFQF
jgi:hypothetical protein